jgi:sugar phosphate isomerase/epimerase
LRKEDGRVKIVLCNEVLGNKVLGNKVLDGMSFAAQCDFAAALGYDGLELAPFTLGDEPHLLGSHARAELRRAAADAGIEITGLHWLLITPQGLSITTADEGRRRRTLEVMRRLIDLCASLGGRMLVHGSPAQRQTEGDPDAALRGRDAFAAIAADAERAGVTYCIEPLSRQETSFITTLQEAVEIVEAVASPAVRTMLDCRAARLSETATIAELLDRWLPTGMIGHVHVNDRNRRGPGQGGDLFAPVFASLARNHYAGAVGVEPFVYEPDGPAVAARSIGYIRGLLEVLAWQRLEPDRAPAP